MGRFRKVVWILAALSLLAVLWAFPLLRKSMEEDVDGPAQAMEGTTESFDFTGPAVLSFVDLNGNISFAKAEREEERKVISIVATRKARGADQNQAKAELEKVSVEFNKTKEGVEVRSRTGSGLFKKPSSSKRVDFRIVAPEGIGIWVTNGRGAVTMKGVQGDIKLEGPALSVDLNDVRGRLTVRTDKGDIRVTNAIGETRAETREGSVTLTKVSGAALIASGSKDVTIKDGGAESDLKASSTNGSITLDRSKGNVVVVEAKGGQISVTDTTGDSSLTATAKNGSMSFSRVNAARFQASTEAGDLDLTDVQGGLDLKTQKGSVTVWRATAKALKISGTSDANFFGELPKEGESSIQITAGSISVYVGKESAFKLDAKTGAGKIAVDQRLQLDTQDGEGSSRIRGVANGGSALLSLSTGAGDIKISTGGPPTYFTPGGAR